MLWLESGRCSEVEETTNPRGQAGKTGTSRAPLACPSRTFAASRHSITLTLNWEVAALFISTQLLAITKTAPLGSLTSVALRGLNSISLAYWKKSSRGKQSFIRVQKNISAFMHSFYLKKVFSKNVAFVQTLFTDSQVLLRHKKHSSEQDRFCICPPGGHYCWEKTWNYVSTL